MPAFYSTDEPLVIANTNVTRTSLKITNQSDTTVYVAKFGETEGFASRAWPIKLDGVFEIEGVNCYKGPIWAIVSAESDVRIWES